MKTIRVSDKAFRAIEDEQEKVRKKIGKRPTKGGLVAEKFGVKEK